MKQMSPNTYKIIQTITIHFHCPKIPAHSNNIRKLRIIETLLIQNLQPQLNIVTCSINLTSFAIFSCLYDFSSPTVFEIGFTVFNHYILTAKLNSPIARNFILPLYLYLLNSQLLSLCRHNYAVFEIVSFLCTAVYSSLVPL